MRLHPENAGLSNKSWTCFHHLSAQTLRAGSRFSFPSKTALSHRTVFRIGKKKYCLLNKVPSISFYHSFIFLQIWGQSKFFSLKFWQQWTKNKVLNLSLTCLKHIQVLRLSGASIYIERESSCGRLLMCSLTCCGGKKMGVSLPIRPTWH